jgi:hypothetical protein
MNEDRATLKRLKMLPRLFRKEDAEKVAPHTGIFLSRAVKSGFITRINRGNYINSFLFGFPQIEEIACFLKPPSYISCEWALNYHGITLQVPNACTIVTLSTSVGSSRNIIYQDIIIEFSKISNTLFKGFTCSGGVCIASPEKALLDTIYLHGSLPAADEIETNRLNIDLLTDLAMHYPRSVMANIRSSVLTLFKPAT